jgi:hypothetical protein
METEHPSLHQLSLAATAEQVTLDHCATLSWSVLGVGASVSSIHLTVFFDGAPYLIARMPEQGSSEVIFTRRGRFTFRLTATFGDGKKAGQELTIEVR